MIFLKNEPCQCLGDVTDETKVLDWLINNRNVGDDAERLEEVNAKTLEGMVSTSEGIVVLFCKQHFSCMILDSEI